MNSRSTTTDRATPSARVRVSDLHGRLDLYLKGQILQTHVEVCENGCLIASALADRHREVCGR